MSEIKPTWVFGRVAEAMGLITAEQREESAGMQEELEEEGISLKFGEVLVEGGVLKEAQIGKVLSARPEETPDPGEGLFGTIALENGFLDGDGLEACLAIQKDLAEELADPEKVPKIGELLLTEEKMEPAEVEAVLKVQQRLKLGAFSLTPSKMLLLKKKKKTLKVRSPEEALFCKMAVRKHLLSPEAVGEILKVQMEDPRPRTAGEIAYELGYMDQLDVAELQEAVNRKEGVKERRRRHQTTSSIDLLGEDKDFNAAALKNGFVTQAQVKKAEKLYKVFRFLEYSRNVGEILFDLGYLNVEQIRAVTDIQRLKGAPLPPYRLEEIVLTDKEDEVVSDIIRAGEKVTQGQVTECVKIQRELRKYGVRRRIGEIMMVKGYLYREDLKRRPVVRRDRPRRYERKTESKETGSRNTLLIAVGGGVGVGLIVLLLALAFSSGGGGAPEPDGGGRKGEAGGAAAEAVQKPGPDETGPTPGRDPASLGYVKWKGRWIRKEKRKADSRRRFYTAFRDTVRER